MPHSVAITLGYNEFKLTKITLVLADRSNETKDPLLLGNHRRQKGRICLKIGNIPMTFDMEKLIQHPLIDNQAFYVDDISELAEKSFVELCSDDPLESSHIYPKRNVQHRQ
ncbi:hypothetical protein Bca101_007464 [Brassica carinata]